MGYINLYLVARSNKKGVLDTVEASITPIPNIHMNDIAKGRGKRDWCSGSSGFANGSHFSEFQNRFSIQRGDVEVILEACLEVW